MTDKKTPDVRCEFVGRLRVRLLRYPAANAKSDDYVVLHHGILHTAEHFDDLISELNDRRLNVAMIEQVPRDSARFPNTIGLGSFRDGMKKALEWMDDEKQEISCYVLHSMGARIGQMLMKKRTKLQHPTVLMAPVPRGGALPVVLRIVWRSPWLFFKSILCRSVKMLADAKGNTRLYFFDENADEAVVQKAKQQFVDSPYLSFCQLLIPCFPIADYPNRENAMMLLHSETDEIFHRSQYSNLESDRSDLKQRKMMGGHDFFIPHAKDAADAIAGFLAKPRSNVREPHMDKTRGSRRRTGRFRLPWTRR